MLDFDFEWYKSFCKKNNFKSSNYQSLALFENFCLAYGINTRPLKQKWHRHFSLSVAFLFHGGKYEKFNTNKRLCLRN